MASAAAAAARSVLRSPSVRTTAARLGAGAKSAAPRSASSSTASPSATRKPLTSHRIFRCPAEMSACVGSMQPFHTATASALMTSMLSLSCRDYGWLSEV